MTGIETLNLVLGVLGTASGMLALGWSGAVHVLTGARVTVTCGPGLHGDLGLLTVTAGTMSSKPNGYPEATIVVVARNRGRTAVTVESVVVGCEEAQMFDGWNGQPLPVRLEGGSSASWYTSADHFLALIGALKKPASSVTASVRLGTGRSETSKSLPIQELAELAGLPIDSTNA